MALRLDNPYIHTFIMGHITNYIKMIGILQLKMQIHMCATHMIIMCRFQCILSELLTVSPELLQTDGSIHFETVCIKAISSKTFYLCIY